MSLCKQKSNFICNSDPILLNDSNKKTTEILNNNNFKLNTKNKLKNKAWNDNNTLDSKVGNPSITAPDWWYPKDKYDPNHFKSEWKSDKYDAKYNILGDSRRFWQFN